MKKFFILLFTISCFTFAHGQGLTATLSGTDNPGTGTFETGLNPYNGGGIFVNPNGNFTNLTSGFSSARLFDTVDGASFPGFSEEDSGTSGTFAMLELGITTSEINDLYAGDWEVEITADNGSEISGFVTDGAVPEPSSGLLGLCACGVMAFLRLRSRWSQSRA